MKFVGQFKVEQDENHLKIVRSSKVNEMVTQLQSAALKLAVFCLKTFDVERWFWSS